MVEEIFTRKAVNLRIHCWRIKINSAIASPPPTHHVLKYYRHFFLSSFDFLQSVSAVSGFLFVCFSFPFLLLLLPLLPNLARG